MISAWGVSAYPCKKDHSQIIAGLAGASPYTTRPEHRAYEQLDAAAIRPAGRLRVAPEGGSHDAADDVFRAGTVPRAVWRIIVAARALERGKRGD